MASRRSPVSFDPNRPDFAPYGLTCVHWRPSPMRRPDHHNEVELNFLESGTVTYLLAAGKTVVDSGRCPIRESSTRLRCDGPGAASDHHNEVELNFLESGTVTYLLGGRKTVVDSGRLEKVQ